MTTRKLLIASALSWLATSGCLLTYDPESPKADDPPRVPESTSNTSTEPVAVRPVDPSADATAYLDKGDASRLLDIISVEGTPEQASRLHACMKMRYDTLGRILQGRGVSFSYTLPVTSATTCPGPTGAATSSQKANFLYCDSRVTLGLPQYPARIAEAYSQTAASSVKMHDLFLAAADEIIAAFPAGNSPASCKVGGAAVKLFDGNSCVKDGVSCILGFTPGADVMNLCNQIVAGAVTSGGAADPATGKRIAVGALLSVAHMCE